MGKVNRKGVSLLFAVSEARLLARELMLSSVAVATLPLLPPLMGLSSYNLFPTTDIQDVEIALGSTDGALAFNPAEIRLKAGRLYRLQLKNPSSQTHYFTALEFAAKAYTVLVLAGQPAVEIKGSVSEVALKGGASATWILVPMKPGKYPLKCTVKGHTEAGMVGSIIVSEP
eukprot:jgi/Chlat1/7631/Chrsp64S07162